MREVSKFFGKMSEMEAEFFRDFKPLKTERLIIRKLTLDDAKDIYEFTSLKETSEFLTWYPHQNIETTRKFLEDLQVKYRKNLPSQWGIELLTENKIIGIAGFITFFPEHKKGELAFVLSPKYQNRGYMTEALGIIVHFGFEVMELNRIEAKCEIDNFASERVLQKIGMQLEGCCYEYLVRKGIFRDYKIYALLKKYYDEKN